MHGLNVFQNAEVNFDVNTDVNTFDLIEFVFNTNYTFYPGGTRRDMDSYSVSVIHLQKKY